MGLGNARAGRVLDFFVGFLDEQLLSTLDVAVVDRLERDYTGRIRSGLGEIRGFVRNRMNRLRPELDPWSPRVVHCQCGYQKPHRPQPAAALTTHAIDAVDYANPRQLPPGGVLVVGSGQTGCQIAEELCEDGREVHLACGRAPWIPRRVEGRDIVSWLEETTFFNTKVTDLPDPAMKLLANPQCSGGRGGHDLNYRTLQKLGVKLTGHFAGVDDGVACFADDLATSVAFGDARWAEICTLITERCDKKSVPVPDLPRPAPFAADSVTGLDLHRVATVVFTSGYRPDFVRWVGFPDAFDARGFPLQVDGSSTVVPGLHFMGVHWQRTRKSATFLGVAEDAAVLAERITASPFPTRRR